VTLESQGWDAGCGGSGLCGLQDRMNYSVQGSARGLKRTTLCLKKKNMSEPVRPVFLRGLLLQQIVSREVFEDLYQTANGIFDLSV
jgi:hypothetical protein